MSYLTVGFLVTSTSRWTTILLRLSTTRIYNNNKELENTSSNKRTIEGNKKILNFSLGLLIYIYKSITKRFPTLLIIGNNSSRDSLTNSYKMKSELQSFTINLSNTTTTLNSNTDIKVSKSISTKKKNRLNSLHLKTFGLHDINRLTI